MLTDRQTDRPTVRQTDRQTDRQTNKGTGRLLSHFVANENAKKNQKESGRQKAEGGIRRAEGPTDGIFSYRVASSIVAKNPTTDETNHRGCGYGQIKLHIENRTNKSLGRPEKGQSILF